jgi:hypothetical protein
MMALVGVNNAGNAAESTSAIYRGHMLELCCNHLLSLSHNESDNLCHLFFSDICSNCSSSDNLNEYLTPLLSSLHLFALLLTLLITEHLTKLLILIILSSVLVKVSLSSPHENLFLDSLSLASLPLLLLDNLLTTRILGHLSALVAPLLHLFGLKFCCPVMALSTVHREERLSLLLKEGEGACVGLNTDVNCFVNQETVMAETHFTHLEEGLVAADTCHFSCPLLITLPSVHMLTILINSGHLLLNCLMLLMISGPILIILLFISGVHLHRS